MTCILKYFFQILQFQDLEDALNFVELMNKCILQFKKKNGMINEALWYQEQK